MKKILIPFVLLVVLMMSSASCSSYKKVAYFQNIDSVDLSPSRGLYDAKIKPKDLLTITVSMPGNQETAVPFNLIVPNAMTAGSRSTYSQALMQDYLVDNDGNIVYPLVGTLHVAGMTKKEVEQLVQEKIKPYLESSSDQAIVTVRMSNYKISVFGEVASPKVITVGNEKISILEALAQAGDLTIYGKRENVKLIRERADGQKEVHILNLNDANLINSPYYYLQQNDAIYVEPNKAKAQNSQIGSMTSIWFSATSILVSLASLMYNILK